MKQGSWMRGVPAMMGLLAVGLGAFGAHALKNLLEERGTLEIWQTAVLYHLLHSVAALWAVERSRVVLGFWAAGVVLFSGSLYVLSVTGARWLGAITPFGGVFLLAGWAALALVKGPASVQGRP